MKKLVIVMICAALIPICALANDASMISNFAKSLKELERQEGGHIGVAVLNTANGQRLEYRANRRFAMCSTFKFLLVADVLARVDEGLENLTHSIVYGKADILDYAPITQKHLQQGRMNIADLSAAAIEYSDNTAANLLLQDIGGPQKLTDYVRSLGDKVTRIDRNEPTINTNLPDDERDTTTPRAMVDTMKKLLVDDTLSPASKSYLIELLVGNTTGDKKLRAGLKQGWKVGDKTGSGQNGASNDIAIAWPAKNKPVLISVYYSGAMSNLEKKNKVIAEIGRIVSAALYP